MSTALHEDLEHDSVARFVCLSGSGKGAIASLCQSSNIRLDIPVLQERLRQQIEEIKEQEANYDADAALAMAMFEHSEARIPEKGGIDPPSQCFARIVGGRTPRVARWPSLHRRVPMLG